MKEGPLYSWGELGPGPFLLRLGGLWLVTFTVLGVPIAAATFNPSRVSSKCIPSFRKKNIDETSEPELKLVIT